MRLESIPRLAIVLAALLSGCASAGSQGPAAADMAKLAAGVTSRAEVLALLGKPRRIVQLDRQQREVWEYRRYDDPTSEHHIAVQFSPDGLVREVLMLKDFSREPCGA